MIRVSVVRDGTMVMYVNAMYEDEAWEWAERKVKIGDTITLWYLVSHEVWRRVSETEWERVE